MQIYAASAPLGYLAGKQLTEIFSNDVTHSFKQLWDEVLTLDERGELDSKLMSFGGVEMRFTSKRTVQINGTVEVTKTATGGPPAKQDFSAALCQS